MKDRSPDELKALLNHLSPDSTNQLIENVVKECILLIRLQMPRNGMNSIENIQSRKHIQTLIDKFGIEQPVEHRPIEWE